jgi:hypothetical protein
VLEFEKVSWCVSVVEYGREEGVLWCAEHILSVPFSPKTNIVDLLATLRVQVY